jgi:hypothetical protein
MHFDSFFFQIRLAGCILKQSFVDYELQRELMNATNPASSPADRVNRPRERSLNWIIAICLVGLSSDIGFMVRRFASFSQGFPLTPREHLLFSYGPLAIPLFGVLAAAAWILSDVYFRGRWIQWFLFAFFAFVLFGIFVALMMVPAGGLVDYS